MGDPAATLFIRKSDSGMARWLTFGGEPSRWVVGNGRTELAIARSWFTRYLLEIEVGGRSLTAHMPGILGPSIPRSFEVVEDATGRRLVEGTIRSGGSTPVGAYGEEWAVTLAGGVTFSWIYRRGEPHKLGFYQGDGARLMAIGHDSGFEADGQTGTLGVLLRFWAAAEKSVDRYIARFEDGVIGEFVRVEDAPVLALLGMWLERTAQSRYAPVGGAGS
jgi:hypothetical protein